MDPLISSQGLDVGSADLVIKGKIRVKNGVEPTHFTPSGIVFNDGSELDADAVIFATGYAPPLEIASDFFGEEIGKKITPIWGLNEEGELKRACTPSGHPGVNLFMTPFGLLFPNLFLLDLVGNRRFLTYEVLFKVIGTLLPTPSSYQSNTSFRVFRLKRGNWD